MKTRSNKVLNSRPHPSPLPQERENRSPSHEISCDWICQMIFRESRSVRLLFPLPGGEGQGEGECSN
jgi:hypothetical protein